MIEKRSGIIPAGIIILLFAFLIPAACASPQVNEIQEPDSEILESEVVEATAPPQEIEVVAASDIEALVEALTFSSQIPTETPNGINSSYAELGVFAWQEFVAVNWPAMPRDGSPAPGQSPYVRGMPAQDALGATGPDGVVVWETYKHKSEIYPGNLTTTQTACAYQPPATNPLNQLPPFDSTVCYGYSDNNLKSGQNNPSFTLFNNLDESNEIGLADMWYTPNGMPVLFEAKANQIVYDYVRENGLQDEPTRSTATGATANMLKGTPVPSGDLTISFPDNSILVKATWRMYDPTIDGDNLDRYHSAEAIYYTGSEFGPKEYHNATFLLIGLHIIQKTPGVPTFTFATFEHVDNEQDGYLLQNKNVPANPAGLLNVIRQHPIPDEIQTLNQMVQEMLRAEFGDDVVWANYQLIGIQAMPTSEPTTNVPPQQYYLANFVTESNCALQYFSGFQSGGGLPVPTPDVYQPDGSGGYTTFIAGGCLGCHGVAQTNGADFSFTLSNAPNRRPDPADPLPALTPQPQDCSNIVGIDPEQPQPLPTPTSSGGS